MDKHKKHVQITLKKSLIGRSEKVRSTVYALGLRKINSRRVHELNDALQGMIDKVAYLLDVREIDEKKGK